MEWLKCTISTNTPAEDLLSEALQTMGIQGVQIEDKVPLSKADTSAMFIDILPDLGPDDGKATLSFYVDSSMSREQVCEIVKKAREQVRAFVDPGEGEPVFSLTQEEDWVNNWKAFFKPFEADEHIVIKPTWEEYKAKGPEELVVEMDPGTAFGTGSHETTKLCIQGMRPFVHPETRVLDVGCGSGILFIIALLLGAKEAVAVDIDPKAVKAAGENAQVNQLPKEKYQLLTGDLISQETLQQEVGGDYDLVFANILADVILPLSGKISTHMKPGGIFLCSGIIEERGEEVKEALLGHGFLLLKETHMGEWVAFIAKKPE